MSAGRALRRHLLAGLVVAAPLGITVFVLWWVFERLDSVLGRFLYPALPFEAPGLGLLLLLVLLIAVGWMAERAIGSRMIGSWHALLERFPLTRRVYSASNRIVRTLVGEDRRLFREVVLVEYPSAGRWSIGFVTGKAPAEASERVHDGVSIFVPSTPNPTTGWIAIVSSADVVPLPMSVEEAFTYILSAGSVPPGFQPPPGRAAPAPPPLAAGGPDRSGTP